MSKWMYISIEELLNVIGYTNFVANFYSVKDDIEYVRLVFIPEKNFVTVDLFGKSDFLKEQMQFDTEYTSTGRRLYKEFFRDEN